MFCLCDWRSSIYNVHDLSHGVSNTIEYSIRSLWTLFFIIFFTLRNANVICIKIFARNPFPRNIVKLVASSTSVASSQSFVVGQPLPLPLPPPDSLNTDCGWHYNLLCLVWGELVIIVFVISIIIIAITKIAIFNMVLQRYTVKVKICSSYRSSFLMTDFYMSNKEKHSSYIARPV